MRQTRKQKRSYKRVKWIIGVALVVLVAVMGVMAASHQNGRSGNGKQLTAGDSHIMHVMIMGVDSRGDDVGRSDTLFVVMFDSSNKSASLLSVPRDTRVRIDGHGWDKINHAYAYGGRELTQKTVEELLGIKINNYVMVDFKGFTGLVDAIGGLQHGFIICHLERVIFERV